MGVYVHSCDSCGCSRGTLYLLDPAVVALYTPYHHHLMVSMLLFTLGVEAWGSALWLVRYNLGGVYH